MLICYGRSLSSHKNVFEFKINVIWPKGRYVYTFFLLTDTNNIYGSVMCFVVWK